MGSAWSNPLDLLFTNSVGSPLDRHNVLRRYYRPFVKECDLPTSLTFHDLRHVAASPMLDRGIPVPLVSAMLGHSPPVTTWKIYAHIIPGSQKQLAESLESIFS